MRYQHDQKKLTYVDLAPAPYYYNSQITKELNDLSQRVGVLRTLISTLSGESLNRLHEYFRLKNIYNTNAIEGNVLSMGETQMVIQEGLTITGKPLKDSVEAKNLATALDFFQELADRQGEPITLRDVKNIHNLILQGIDDHNAGRYRSVFVEISGSKYRPPDPAQVEQMMREMGDWLEKITSQSSDINHDPVILACAIHAWFVYRHPFIDGNGRTARLLMNLVLLRKGYPLTIITKDDRNRYYDALEESQAGDLTPFMLLVLEAALESIEVYEQAAHDQLNLQQFVQSLVTEEQNQYRNAYDVFESAMRLLKGYFRQVVQMLSDEAAEQNITKRVGFKDFGVIEFEKYQMLKESQSAKKTWFYRLAFYDVQDQTHEQTKRYLFFFGYASNEMKNILERHDVTIHVAMEVYPSYYDRLSNIPAQDAPDVLEIAYLPSEEKFVYLDRQKQAHRVRAEELALLFIQQGFAHFP